MKPCNQLVPLPLQFLAHPVVYNLLHDKWYGEFLKYTNRKWTEPEWWIWNSLHLLTLLDVILFPLFFLVFWICHVVTKTGTLMYKLQSGLSGKVTTRAKCAVRKHFAWTADTSGDWPVVSFVAAFLIECRES